MLSINPPGCQDLEISLDNNASSILRAEYVLDEVCFRLFTTEIIVAQIYRKKEISEKHIFSCESFLACIIEHWIMIMT